MYDKKYLYLISFNIFFFCFNYDTLAYSVRRNVARFWNNVISHATWRSLRELLTFSRRNNKLETNSWTDGEMEII